jgi:hypothetical protein
MQGAKLTHSDDKNARADPYLITGKALEKHFTLQSLHFEFHKLFNSGEKNDRAIAIVGATSLDSPRGQSCRWTF